ncbi:MAG: TIGR03118 family protein [Frankiaceae bacterium]
MAPLPRHARSTVAIGAALALAGGLAAAVPALAGQPAGPASAAVALTDRHAGSDSGEHERHGYAEVPLVSDITGLGAVTDAHSVNPWGIAFGPTTPLWVADNGTSSSTLYAGANGSDPLSQLGLVVSTPPQPTGVVFNPTTSFKLPDGTPSRFVFVTLGGQIAAWTVMPSAPPPTSATVVKVKRGAVLTGAALARTGHGARLYVADQAGNEVRVYDGAWHQVRTIRDRTMPAPLAPYNVAVLRDRLYVSYSVPEGVDSSGPEGAVDVFTLRGHFLRRLVIGDPLSGPWGMVVAPERFGRFSGDLLVGNEDGGRINAFDVRTGHFEGALSTPDGTPIAHDGMWGLAFGNGTIGTPTTLIFAAGIGEYGHGLVGAISAVESQD